MRAVKPSSVYNKLEVLIKGRAKKELECKKFLTNIPDILINRGNLEETLFVASESRLYTGVSDYIISAKIRDEDGSICNKAFVWELKAPQCEIFVKDTGNRLKPSEHLVSAENQLFNYYHEIKASPFIQRDCKVHPDDISLGGIIIGCGRTLVRGVSDEQKKIALYERAKFIRKTYLYERIGIRLLTWDTILYNIDLKGTKTFDGLKKLNKKEVTLVLRNISTADFEIK